MVNTRATDEHLPSIIMKMNRGERLNQEEQDRIYFHTDATMRQFERVRSHFTAGVVSQQDWAALRVSMVRTLRTDLARGIWSKLKHSYNEDFRTAVDTALEESSPESDPA